MPSRVGFIGFDQVKRNLELKQNDKITKCPECGNNTHFVLHAERCAEDLCETFVVCVCGYDPTGDSGDRYENVWGEMDKEAATVAFDCWNEAIASKRVMLEA